MCTSSLASGARGHRLTAEEERGIRAPSIRIHYIRPRLATGLSGPKAERAFETIAAWESAPQRKGNRLAVRRDQLCRELRLRRGDGIVGMVAELTNGDLWLGPDILPAGVYGLLSERLRRHVHPGINLSFGGTVGRWEQFIAVESPDAQRFEDQVAAAWPRASPSHLRASDAFVFNAPQVRLPDGRSFTPKLRGYPYPDANSKWVKVELFWCGDSGVWLSVQPTRDRMMRLMISLIMATRPRLGNLNRLAAGHAPWRGVDVSKRMGAWQRRALVYFDRHGSGSAREFAGWCSSTWPNAPAKPRRTLEQMVQVGMLREQRRPRDGLVFLRQKL